MIESNNVKELQAKFNILAFETSCDDTAVAIINSGYQVLADLTAAQLEHNQYGGVVPEIASRMHMKTIMKLTAAALSKAELTYNDIDAVAVSINPGLIGSLLVGVSYAKALSYSINKPLIAINHLLAHIYANKITSPDLTPPFLALVVSGGHTEIVHFKSDLDFQIVGNTLDDAAGEAFDKVAKLLGLGYPGGPIIDSLSKEGNPDFVVFPRAFPQKTNYNFSFSGLKTAIMNYLKSQRKEYVESNINHIAASVQMAIIEPLVRKTMAYAIKHKIYDIVLAGGVSANRLLREEMMRRATKGGIRVFIPPIRYCMDNAAMVGAAAVVKYRNQDFAALDLNPFSTKGTKDV